MSDSKWSDAAVSFLTLMWPVASAQEIADQLTMQTGAVFTRNMVIGKSHRLKLPKIPKAERVRRIQEVRPTRIATRFGG